MKVHSTFTPRFIEVEDPVRPQDGINRRRSAGRVRRCVSTAHAFKQVPDRDCTRYQLTPNFSWVSGSRNTAKGISTNTQFQLGVMHTVAKPLKRFAARCDLDTSLK